MAWYAKLSTDELVASLQKANWTYHNTSKSLMNDDDYDRGLEELKKRSPSHPFLSLVGASVANESMALVLPVTMGSQDKVRDGEPGLERWIRRQGQGQIIKRYIITEKLDGLSALLIIRGSSTDPKSSKKSLYLRGDGVKGVDVSSICDLIHLLGGASASAASTGDCIVRGELLLRRDDTPAGSIGRSLVNGWVHRGSADAQAHAALSKVRFVAYQVIEPTGLSRSAQLSWLTSKGFETPWSQGWPAMALLGAGALKGVLIDRKGRSPYPLDGLVIGTDTVPVGLGGGEARNPPDSVAFKASLDEQKAQTTVVGVEWKLNRQQIWYPRIQIEPVEIGGATIQWLSGHNAGMIAEHRLGPGSVIIVRRSGDVIPTLDSVIQATEAQMPEAGTWVWDDNKVHAVASGSSAAEGESVQSLLHAFQTLGVEGIGPGLVQKVVEGGFTTMKKVWDAKESDLADCIGAGRAPAFIKSLKERRATASIGTLVVASNRLPRGIGERKLRAVFDKESDPAKWSISLYPVEGWSAETFQELLDKVPKVLDWIRESFPGPLLLPLPLAPTPAASLATATKFVVFSGVRDKVLEGKLAAAGWAMEDSVTKKTTALVVPEDAKETGKLKKARDLGIQILTLAAFQKSLH